MSLLKYLNIKNSKYDTDNKKNTNTKDNLNNKDALDDLDKIKSIINDADGILIGAGSGLSTSAGLTYSGPRFEENFADFIKKYNMSDMYSAGFYPFETEEEKWAYWSKHIYFNRYDVQSGKPYVDLFNLIKDKNYFVLTTNVDHQFQLAGFSEDKIFATQGDYGLFQCKKACHDKLYGNEEIVKKMIKNKKIVKYLLI
ncbi:hypothetical protein [Intestinibacter sp.]